MKKIVALFCAFTFIFSIVGSRVEAKAETNVETKAKSEKSEETKDNNIEKQDKLQKEEVDKDKIIKKAPQQSIIEEVKTQKEEVEQNSTKEFDQSTQSELSKVSTLTATDGYTEFTVSKAKPVQLVNNTSNTITIKYGSNTAVGGVKPGVDYIDYTYSGSISNLNHNYHLSISVPSGDKIRFSASTDTDVNLEISNDYYGMINQTDTFSPVFYEYKMQKDKGYELSNGTGKQITVLRDSDSDVKYDSVYYDGSGNVKNMYVNSSSSKIYIDSGYMNRISIEPSVTSNFLRIFIPYDNKDMIKEVDTPAISVKHIYLNKGYEINNPTNGKTKILTDASFSSNNKYDYVQYDESGNVSSTEIDETSNFYIDKGHKDRITLSSGYDCVLYMPYELEFKEVTDPAVYRFDVSEDSNYEINNNSNLNPNKKSFNIYTDNSSSSRYEYIDYDSTGAIYSQNIEKYGDSSMPFGYKKRLSLEKGNPITFYVPYEYKNTIQKSQNPAFSSYTLTIDKSYQIQNTTNSTVKVLNDGDYSNKIEYVDYDSAGKISNQVVGGYDDFYVQSQHNTIVDINKGTAVTLYIAYEYKDLVKEAEDSAFNKIGVAKNTSLEVNNTLDDQLALKNTGDYYTKVNYANYDSSGNISQISRDQYGTISIDSKNKKRICSSDDQNIIIYVPNKKEIETKIVANPVFYEQDLCEGKNYEIDNSNNTQKILSLVKDTTYSTTNSKSTYDCIVFDKSGKITDVERDILDNNNVEAYNKMRISTNKGNGLKIYIPYEYASRFKEVSTPVFFQFNLEKDKSYELTNNTNLTDIDVPIYNTSSSNGSKYDYIRLDSTGKTVKYAKDSYDIFHAFKGQKEKISISQGDNLTLYIPYEMKDIIKESTPLFYKKKINKGEQFVVKNNYDYTINLTTIGSDSNGYTARVYDSNMNSKKYITITKSTTISMEPNDSIVIFDTNAENIDIDVQYEAMGFDGKHENEDLNKDGKVDLIDLAAISNSYNVTYKDRDWNSFDDLNYDGIVDIYDIVKIGRKIN